MTTDPSPLAEQIAREHHLYLIEVDETEARAPSVVCECDEAFVIPASDFPERVIAAHIATVTERAVRERVAGEERRRLTAALRAKFGVTNRAADYIERLPDGWADQRDVASGEPDE